MGEYAQVTLDESETIAKSNIGRWIGNIRSAYRGMLA